MKETPRLRRTEQSENFASSKEYISLYYLEGKLDPKLTKIKPTTSLVNHLSDHTHHQRDRCPKKKWQGQRPSLAPRHRVLIRISSPARSVRTVRFGRSREDHEHLHR